MLENKKGKIMDGVVNPSILLKKTAQKKDEDLQGIKNFLRQRDVVFDWPIWDSSHIKSQS